jgi:hypothetical protein
MIPRYAYYMPFTVKFPNKCEWQKEYNADSKGGLVWYKDGSKTNKALVPGCIDGTFKRGYSFSLGLHTAVFQAGIIRH